MRDPDLRDPNRDSIRSEADVIDIGPPVRLTALAAPPALHAGSTFTPGFALPYLPLPLLCLFTAVMGGSAASRTRTHGTLGAECTLSIVMGFVGGDMLAAGACDGVDRAAASWRDGRRRSGLGALTDRVLQRRRAGQFCPCCFRRAVLSRGLHMVDILLCWHACVSTSTASAASPVCYVVLCVFVPAALCSG